MKRESKNDGNKEADNSPAKRIMPTDSGRGVLGGKQRNNSYALKIMLAEMEDEDWSPYLSVEDAYKLGDGRDALRRGDLESAAKYGRIYELRPVAHQ